MANRLVIAAILVSTGVALALAGAEIRSPSGSTVAVISSIRSESVVTVRTADGRDLGSYSLVSDDGEHGYSVDASKWSPDSQYFVFTAENVGGHQPWRIVAAVFALKTRRFIPLDESCIGVVSIPEISFRGSNTAVLTIWESVVKNTTREVAIPLDTLESKCKAAGARAPSNSSLQHAGAPPATRGTK